MTAFKDQNAWEQRKLGEIGSFKSGVGFPESEQGGMTGVPFYKVSDMNLSENNTVMNISSNYVTDDQISRNKWKPIDGNTIIFAKVGAAVFLERKRQTRCKFLIDNNMMSYKPNSIQDHDYIYYTFQNLNLSHYAQIGSLPSLNAGELKNVNIVLPDQNEQSKVSQLFLNLDRTITLHEEQHRQLEQLKKALLQKMFANETGYPALRFKGFTEKWEQRKLGEEFQHINERNDGSFDNTRYISVANMYFKDPNDVQSNNILTRTYVMRRDDIAFEGHPSKKYKFGRFVANDIGDGVVSELFPVYRHVSKYDAKYWKYAIQIESIMAPLFAKSITSSGNSSNKLNPKHFLRQMVKVPDLNEQIKIGEFLSKFDAIITLHDKKIQYLKQLKRGLLQKMFV